MSLKIAINGFGRIGRSITRLTALHTDIELVAINDIMSIDMMVYLLAHDSVHGNFKHDIKIINDNCIQIGKNKIQISHKNHPKEIDFQKSNAQLVIECTGLFLTYNDAKFYIQNGIKKVIFSAPTKDEITPTFVLGVNEHEYKGQDIISNASCTTNCLAPIAKVIDDNFGIEKGLMTTIHSYTNDQNILDASHRRDIRRTRAAAINMIPTSTGAAKAINRVLPKLAGKLHGQSVRVPIPDVSMMDLNLVLKTNVTKKQISNILKLQAKTTLKGILLIDEQMRVSQDFVNSTYSAIVADDLIQVIDKNMIKIMAWYDNEWGYSNRLIDMALYITAKGEKNETT